MAQIEQGKEGNSLEDTSEHRPKVLKKQWEHLAEAEKCTEERTETTRKARTWGDCISEKIQNDERQTDELQDVLTIFQKQPSVAETVQAGLEGGESSAEALMDMFLAVPEKRQ